MPSQSLASIDPDGLESYFTDAEHLRAYFSQTVAAPTLDKRLLMIHGVGGVGKSSLLLMFRLHCKSVNIPVALASGDDSKSALDVLTHWADDLKADKIALPRFSQTFEHYRAIQAKVENETRKIAGQAVKGAAKTIIETAASTIPGVGPLLGKLGGMSVEALADILLSRGFKKSDIDLLLDPAKKLTADFLTDAANVADKRRIVLMLDTFEQMTVLDGWAREIAQRLHPNVLLVIAGRAMPSKWMAYGQIEELAPMPKRVMQELVRRYYRTFRPDEPDPKQVDSIIEFARGLPMAVTTAVQLWITYKIKDFQVVKSEAFEDLVDELRRGLLTEMYPFLEAAATVRWFNKDVLRALTSEDDVAKFYIELRRFPFVRSRAEGLALHDRMREIFDDYLRLSDSQRYHELHERAAEYFEKRLEKMTGEEAERLGLERLYHHIRADEEAGIKLFQEMAEELTRYRLVNRLRTLLNDANTYSLEHENGRRWVEYYNARLAYLETRYADAEKGYQAIGENERVEPKLRAYALCDWGQVCKNSEYLNEPGGKEKCLDILERSQQLIPLDSKLAFAFVHRKDVYTVNAQWQMAALKNWL
jgi:hypothetical protein